MFDSKFLKRVGGIEGEMKLKIAAYSKAKGNMQAIERKATYAIQVQIFLFKSHAITYSGSLLMRSLDDLVKKSQFVQDSEYLVTLLVVVPKYVHWIAATLPYPKRFSYLDWKESYNTLTQFVVPNSSE